MSFWSRNEPKVANTKETNTDSLACSFCRKKAAEVSKLIAGPGVHICDECVVLCQESLGEGVGFPEAPSDLDRLSADIQAGVVGHDKLVRQLAGVIRRHIHGGIDGLGGPIVLLVGSSGVGKTKLCAALCAAAPIPSHHAHANRVSATGYIGDDVENLLYEVIEAAGHQYALASRGLLVIEDIHHIARRAPPEGGPKRDIVGAEVQRQLLRIMDGLAVRAPIAAWQARHPQDDTHRLFPTRGMQLVLTCRMDRVPETEGEVRRVLAELGLLPELLARVALILPVRSPGVDSLRRILVDDLLTEATALVADLGGQLNVTEDVVDEIVQEAAVHGDGAWTLRQRVAILVDRAFSGETG